MDRATLARFLRNVRRPDSGSDGCWIWTGPVIASGYGKFRTSGQGERMAHRVAYEHYVGPIPPTLQIDHLCRVRLCVRPTHLEPVTGSENTRRQDHANRRVTRCPQGHAYTAENTLRTVSGSRRCRECERLRKRASRHGGT